MVTHVDCWPFLWTVPFFFPLFTLIPPPVGGRPTAAAGEVVMPFGPSPRAFSWSAGSARKEERKKSILPM